MGTAACVKQGQRRALTPTEEGTQTEADAEGRAPSAACLDLKLPLHLAVGERSEAKQGGGLRPGAMAKLCQALKGALALLPWGRGACAPLVRCFGASCAACIVSSLHVRSALV